MVERRAVTVSEGFFLVLVAVVPIMQPWNVPLLGYPIPPVDFLFLIAASAAALSLLSGRAALPRSPVIVALVLYGVAFAASAATSADRPHSVVKLLGIFYLIGLALLTMVHVRSIDALRRAMTAWLVGTIVTVGAAFTGLLLFAAGVTDPQTNLFLSIHGSLPDGGYPRIMALFQNPNMYCAYMVASLAMLLTARRVGWFRRGALAFAGAVIVAAVFSLSPGLGGLLIVIAFGAWCEWYPNRPLLVTSAIVFGAIGAVLCLLATVAVPAPHQSLSLWHLRASSRLLTWIGSWGTFLAHPLLGKGVGVDVVAIGYTNPSGVYEWLTDAHNTWLSVLAQEGLAGFAALAVVIAALLKGASLSMAPPQQALHTGLMVAFVTGFLYQGFTGSFENTRHIWVLIGLLAASKTLAQRQMSVGPENPGPPAAT
jgi:hypothetical protein